MNLVKFNFTSLKYLRFKLSGCKDVGIRKFEFVAKTLFPYVKIIKFKKSFSFKHNSFKETFTLRDENIIIMDARTRRAKKLVIVFIIMFIMFLTDLTVRVNQRINICV